jgi:hypothetical protein
LPKKASLPPRRMASAALREVSDARDQRVGECLLDAGAFR